MKNAATSPAKVVRKLRCAVYTRKSSSAVKVMGDETLMTIARELVAAVRKNVTIDWTVRESARARIKVMVKRILKRHGYPPDLLIAARWISTSTVDEADILKG